MSLTPDSILADPQQVIANLRRELDECRAEREALRRELADAREQQTATAEVLGVINTHPGDLAPVFEAMLEKAQSLCGSDHGTLFLRDGDYFRPAAMRGVPEPIAERLRGGILGRDVPVSRPLLAGERFVHVINTAQSDHPMMRLAKENGVRALLSVPLRKGSDVLGMIVAGQIEGPPFSEKQIALLQNFAAQAVIAIENARLLGELRQRTEDLQESLEYQTATSDVLNVINRSAFDLGTVLQTVATTAIRLCRADSATIYRNEGGEYRWAAGHMLVPEYEGIERNLRIHPGMGTVVGRCVLAGGTVQILDAWADPLYEAKEDARIGGVRTMIGVPLLREGAPIGAIGLARCRIEAFSEREIQLVSTFADQAVIAMENARLLTETREALEQQTATAEVLQVINSSPGDLTPVFDAMLEKAARICQADSGFVFRLQDGLNCMVAAFGVPTEYKEFQARNPIPLGRGTLAGRAALERRAVHIVDAAADPEYTRAEAVQIGGQRTMLGVPLIREDALIGVITFGRSRVEPFTEKQIALVTTFADQAVIAIENTRLLTELREALEQQQAIAEVLQVINSSPGDLALVFDAVLDKTLRLCGAAFGVFWTFDGERFHSVAVRGDPRVAEWMRQHGATRVAPDTPAGRIVRGERIVHLADATQDEAYQLHRRWRELVDIGGGRTVLIVGLWKESALLGLIAVYRQEVHPFAEKQIGVLQNFAAQAVIGMHNAHLLGEIRQRQAELRVTFDNMGDGVAMFDADRRLAAWNRKFQQILDLPDEFLAGRPRFTEYFHYLAERGEYEADLEAELSQRLAETDQELRLERTRPDGRIIEVRRNAVPGGGFVLIYSDITERKEAEARLRAARDTAEGALRELRAAQANLIHAEKMASLGQLTAGIAHEIKNPLNFVNNFAGLSVELLDELREAAAPAVASLGDDERDEIDDLVATISGNLDKIAEHGKRADSIVTSMLEHSRGSSGERRCVDLNALVEEALNLAYHGGRAQDQSFNITLERDYADTITPIELVPQDITRVCLNLFDNGFYAATKRQREASDTNFKPTLKVSTRDLGDAVEIRIRDNGIGIPPEIKNKLFQPFFTTKPTGEGTGLGLSISYDIVTQQHGGTIEVDSEVGAFTEFTVRLPRGRENVMAERAA